MQPPVLNGRLLCFWAGAVEGGVRKEEWIEFEIAAPASGVIGRRGEPRE
jgi:hypothetical protein